MTLLESAISIIVIGIMITIFSFIPSGIMQNQQEAKDVALFSRVADEVTMEVESVDWSTVQDVDSRITSMLENVESRIETEGNRPFEITGEVMDVEGQKLIKVSLIQGNLEQDYFYGFNEVE